MFFPQACDDDIKRLRCGFLDNRGQAGHSQGAAISCLVHTLQQEQQLKLSANQDPAAKKKLDEIGQISEKCGHEVMRLMELQADDFHLDRYGFVCSISMDGVTEIIWSCGFTRSSRKLCFSALAWPTCYIRYVSSCGE